MACHAREDKFLFIYTFQLRKNVQLEGSIEHSQSTFWSQKDLKIRFCEIALFMVDSLDSLAEIMLEAA